ncbi:hypothetical protein LOAG_00594, partial [Loa loa]
TYLHPHSHTLSHLHYFHLGPLPLTPRQTFPHLTQQLNHHYTYCLLPYSCTASTECRSTYTHIRTYIHTYIHTCIRAYIHTYIHIYIHTCIHTYIHTYIHAHIYLHTYTYSYTHIHRYIHTYIHRYIDTYIHTLIRRHTTQKHATIYTCC